jgi:hypothetical protein
LAFAVAVASAFAVAVASAFAVAVAVASAFAVAVASAFAVALASEIGPGFSLGIPSHPWFVIPQRSGGICFFLCRCF